MVQVITPPVEAEGIYSLPLGMETHVPTTNNNHHLDEAPGWG